jgi:DNA polymerase-3 subunit gamma/tau
LLKIIEEPPAHCVFIFATTEYYKILPTIISRCQFLQFNRFNHNELQKTLDLVIKQEKISIDQKSIVKIIQLANGAARDALTILEQLCSLTNNQITSDDINNAFGIIDNSEKNAFIKLLFTNNCEAALKKIDVFIQNGINIGQFIKDIIGIFIDLLTYQKTKSLEFSNNTNLQELIDSLDNTDFNKITYLIDV